MGHWYPCFGLLIMSPLGFKALFMLCTGTRVTRSMRFTCGTTSRPAWQPSLSLPHSCEQALVGAWNWDLPCRRSQCESRQTLYSLRYAGSAGIINLLLKKKAYRGYVCMHSWPWLVHIVWLFSDCDYFFIAMFGLCGIQCKGSHGAITRTTLSPIQAICCDE